MNIGNAFGSTVRVTITAAASALVAVALLLAFILRKPPAPSQATPEQTTADGTVVLTEQARGEAGVTVEAARTIVRTDRLEAPGVMALDETRTARIGSVTDGKVSEISAEIGDRVPQGRMLAALYSVAVHEAWADYRKAIAELRRAKTEHDYAVQMEERAKRLLAAKAIAEQEVERAQADRVAAEEAVNIAATEVRRAEEELEHLGVTNAEDPAGESGEYIPITAPIAGVVIERLVTQGTAVTAGTPLFVVSNLSSLWALAEIDETALPHVKVGRPVEVRVAAYPGESFDGTIAFVGDIVNPKTRRVTVRCVVPNPDGRLKPEMYATVMLGESDPHSIIAVPSPAVQDLDGRMVVFVEEGSSRFRPREVSVGSDVEGWVEIKAGLQEGERVAATGAFLLKSELLKQTMTEG